MSLRIPILQGKIARRILVNFRVAPDVIRPLLPAPFRPKLHRGSAIAGICLIRLEQIRPRHFPGVVGLSSENAAHRIAVLWEDDQGQTQEGVYIPRRDTSSLLNHLAGGRIFPGEHNHATFQTAEQDDSLQLEMNSADGTTQIRVKGIVKNGWPSGSAFTDLSEASRFFESGSTGYSATRDGLHLDGMALKTKTWQIEAMEVSEVYSSYFSNKAFFPAGSVEFDCALVMRNIEHEWHQLDSMATSPGLLNYPKAAA